MSKKQDIVHDEEFLEKEAPLLHSISKENPFSVPADYFDSLPSEILEKCREVENGLKPFPGKSYIINLKLFVLGYKWRLLTITGCVALLGFFISRINDRPVSYEAMAETIPDSLIVEHLAMNINAINESTLEDLQESENVSAPVKSVSDSANTDQDIIGYLVDHNINVSDIENE